MLSLPTTALAATGFYFRGYDSENVTSYTFAYAAMGATVSGTDVTMQPSASEGVAVGLITLDEEGHDISTSVDLGGLEISFSTLTSVLEEGVDGAENDIPSVDISFCSSSDTGSEISSVHLAKPDTTVSGDVRLSSGASIPAGTRAIFLYLNGTNTSGDNTVAFTDTSLVIHDAAAPSCVVEYNTSWTNQDITVTITAADGDSGLEGIYFNDERVTQTSPYTFVVSENDTSFSAYSMDYAGKQSEVHNITIDNIDKSTPAAPAEVPLSTTNWSNSDVQVLMPALTADGGAPVRYVYQIGASAWADLPDGFVIGDNGITTIRVAVEDAAGNRSAYASATARVDKLAPAISEPVKTTGSGSVRVDVSVADEGESGIDRFLYAEGEQDAAYFSTGGTEITDNYFEVSVGGTYTIFAADVAGNSALKTVSLSTAPYIADISDEVINEDEAKVISLTISDAETALENLTITATASDEELLTLSLEQTSEAVNLTVTPAANQSGGPVTITVSAEDPTGEKTTKQFTVTVTSVNDAPLAQDDSDVTMDEDGVIEIDVLANDSDEADGDTLSISDAGTPEHGTTMIVLGKIRYTPEADYAGTDSFTYEISDGNGGTATAIVSIVIANINDAPSAADDAASTQEDYAVVIPVLDNDSDVDTIYDLAEQIHILSTTDGTHGTTELIEGGIRYTPESNFNGTDTFTYTISDEGGLTSEASVTVSVAPEADDPWFSGLLAEYDIDEDAQGYEISFSVYDVETPQDSLMVQAASLDEALIEQSGIELTGLGDEDPVVSLLLTPKADQYGDVDIMLTLGDGFNTVEQTITIHIANVNDAPRAKNDTVKYVEDAAYVDILVSALLQNDVDIEGDALIYGGIETLTSVGTIEQLNETTLRYTPVANYDGTDSFTYSVGDGLANASATCTLEAIGVNDAPVIVVANGTYSTNEDTLVTIPFTISDLESSASSLSVIAATEDDSIVTTDGMTIINNGDGTGEVRIMPEADANGSVTLTLTVSDGAAQSQDSFTLTVQPTQDAPIAVNDKIYVLYTSRTFAVLNNDHDVDDDTLTVVEPVTAELPGTLTFDPETQLFTYTPTIGENGTSTFDYTITDGTDSANATVTLHVATITHDPVITAINTQYVNEDGTISGITFRVTDEDAGDTATVTVTSGNSELLPNDETHIVLTDLGNGYYSLSLSPAADQFGDAVVTVTATDITERTATSIFTLRVLGENDAPVAQNDNYTLDEDTSVQLNLLDNDSDPDGDTIWITTISTPANGTIVRSGSTFSYYPYGNWNGTETLTYRVSDGHTSTQANVSIVVNPVNDDPIAWADYRELPDEAEQQATINVLGNDYDPDGDTVYTAEIVTQPRHGTAVIEANGSITYTRTEISGESNGADSFTYRIIDREVDDEDARSDTTTVYIGVEFISSLYTYGHTVVCYEDASAFDFDISVVNPNSVDYTLTINGTTALGTFDVVDNNTVTFTPALNQNGYTTIQYTVEEVGGGETDTGTIWLHVYPVNDLPVIDSAPESITVEEDATGGYTFDVTYHDVDCDLSDLYFYVYTTSGTTTAPVPFQTWYSVSQTETGSRVTLHTAQNVNGTGQIVVGVSDGLAYDERTIDLTVTPVDDAPVVTGTSKTIYEDSSVRFPTPGSDSEADGDDTIVSIEEADAPQHGTATIGGDNTIYYVPDKDFYGTDTFYVTITDDTVAALSSRATVTITVTPINDQPEIFDLDYYQTTPEDTEKDVTLRVVDVDNDLSGSSSYTLTSSDQSLVKDENISISQLSGTLMQIHLIPEENAYGTVIIDISASDGELSTEAAFELKVIPVNDIPVAVDDTATADEITSTGKESTPPKTTATIDLTANDSDIEDGKPKVVEIDNSTDATVTNLGNGSVLVSVDGDFSGDITFGYTVMDRAGATASANVTLTVNPVNDPPRASDDSMTINEDESPEISVLTNDTDPEGDELAIDSVTQPSHGAAEISGTKVLYTPDADYYGTDSFTYTVSDGNGGTATATVRITIKPVNDAPTIEKHSSNPDAWTMLEDTPKAFHFVVADAESTTSSLIIKITSLDESKIKTTQIALTTNPEGYKTITVTPESDVNGVVPVRFDVSDGLLTTTAYYNIEILSVNDAPVVTAPQLTVKEDTLLISSASATDADGDSVTYFKATEPAHGTVTVNTDGTFTYMPTANYNGEDSFIIAADDGQSENNIGYDTVYITVKPVGDAPVAVDDPTTVSEDTPQLILVLDNDTDPDIVYGDEIYVLSVTEPAHGTAEKTEGGILYTPEENYNGTDEFRYTIADQDGKTDTALVEITISPVNDAPQNGDDTASVLEDHSVTIDVTANDDIDESTNPELEDVIVTQVDTPAHGSAVIDAGGKTITYTPEANWFSPEGEPEVFNYTAQDSSGETAIFAVSVTVTSVNDLPVITPADLTDISTLEDTQTNAVTFTVGDVETAAGSLIVSVTHNNPTLLPAVSVSPDAEGVCSFTVTPKENKVGAATFTVTVTDANGGSTSDTFVLTVTPENDLPVAQDDAFTVSEIGTRDYNVLANDDVDIISGNGGDTLTLLSIGETQFGTASIVSNLLHYEPDASLSNKENYTDTFTYTMKDASGAESTATVVVTITPDNDAPTISAIADVTDVVEDAPDGTGDIAFTVTDEEDDDDTLTVTISSGNTTLFPLENITVINPDAGSDPTGTQRTVKAIPATDQFGTGSITLTVTDSQGKYTSTTFSVTVTSQNDEPDNGNKSYTVVEDVEQQLDVLAGIDADYDTTPEYIEITGIVTEPSHGSVRIAADNKSIYYVTAQDSNEPDSFQYSIHDSYGNADYTFTVSITVTPVNDAPVITYLGDPVYTIFEGSSQNDIPFTVTDVDNVTYAGGAEPVEVTLSAKSSNTILLRNGINIDTLTGDDRNIDLTPYLKWNGTTTVTITATDPGGLKSTASFTLVVNNLNDTPVAVDDSFTIQEDQATSVNVLANDTDVDLLTNPATESIRIKTVTSEDPNATVTLAEDHLSVLITPNANYNGPVYFTYSIEDAAHAESNTANAVIMVAQVNDAPVVVDDTATTTEDNAVDILVLGNDSDVDMEAGLNAAPEDESISVSITESGLTAPSHGTIETDGTKITYTPDTDYNGTDTFEYNCFDGDVNVTATVTVTITQVNDDPVAKTDTASTSEDTDTLPIDVIANDTDVDTDADLNENALHTRADLTITAATVQNSEHGSVSIVDNKLVFSPALNWFGVAVIDYTISDGNGGTSSSTLSVTVGSVNDLPQFTVAPADMELTEDEADGTSGLTVSDVETAANLLSVTVVSSSNPALIAVSDVAITAGAGGARTVTVNPKDNQNGAAIITLRVTDGDGGNTTITFNVTVAAVNDAPVANDKTLNIDEDASLQTILKSSVSSDVDVATNTDTYALTITTQAQHGTAGIDGDGNLTYVPDKDYNGTDSFGYTATDAAEAVGTATVTVNIAQVNDAPVVVDDTATTTEDNAVDILVLGNDSDVDMEAGLNAAPEDESISVSITESGLTAPSHGTIETDGTKITYTPDTDYNGTDTFEYNCFDGDVNVTATVTVTITQVNDDPVAKTDTASTSEDTDTLPVDVIANDTDVDTDADLNENALHTRADLTITAATVQNSEHGSVSIVDNKLVFSPALNWFGVAVIDYTISDGNGGTSSSTLSVTVGSVNDLPQFTVAPADMELTEDEADGTSGLTVSDVETAANLLSVTVVSSSNPALIAVSDVAITAGAGGARTVTVNPKDNQNGAAIITLRVTDCDGGNTTITFNVTVAAVNDAPVANDKTLNIDEDASLQTILKSSVSSDVDVATNTDTYALTITTQAQHGTAGIDGDGNLTYVPDKDYNGTDSFGYTATDAAEAVGTATVTVNIAQVNDAPVVVDDTATTTEDNAVDILVLGNDSDVDMEAGLNAAPEDESISVSITESGLTAPSHGTIETDGTKITYTPDTDYNGTDTFEYNCFDGDVNVTATVTVTITQVNDDPVAKTDTASTSEDTDTLPIDVIANDTDVDTDADLNENALHTRADLTITAATVQNSEHGSVSIVDNKLVFSPALNWFGVAVIDYTISDGNGGTSSSTLSVTVGSVNDLPQFTVAPADMELAEDEADGTSGLTVSDVETAADVLSVTVVSSSNPALIAVSDVTITAGAGGARTVTVNPKDNQNGAATITLRVTDGDGGNTTITFNVTVAAVNDAPVANDKTLNIDEDASLQTILKSSVSSDVDVATNTDTYALTITTPAQHGTAGIDGDGNLTYVPDKDYNGTDSFGYTATDAAEAIGTATVTVNIAQVNDAPEVGDDTATTTEDNAVDILVLGNDSDVDMEADLNAAPEDESISVSISESGLTAPSHGSIETDGTKITYTPDTDYNGTDTFEYNCFDGDVNVTATVTVTITQVNDDPAAVADSATTPEDTTVRVNVLANDTDVDTIEALNANELHSKDSFSITSYSLSGTPHGTLTQDGAELIFDPVAEFSGTQVIEYVLSDGHGGTSTGTLTIGVNSVNDAPVANNDTMSADEDNAASVNVLTNDTDVDTGDTLTFVGFTEPTSGLPGTFETTAGGDVTFTPNANYNGSFTIGYQIRDAEGLTATANITVTINAVNDKPTADDASASTNEDTAKAIDVSGLIGDADIVTNADALTVSVAASGEPLHGTVSVDGTTITYTPDENFNGTDEITYTVTDKAGSSDDGMLSITVNPVNDAPVARNDESTTNEDTPVVIYALTNDSDVDTDEELNAEPAGTPVIQSVGNGTYGTAETDGAKITYTPDENFNGTDTLAYVITDGTLTAEAEIQITIKQVNDQIVALDDTATTNDEEMVSIDVLANDTDVDTDSALNKDALHERSSFVITAVGTPENGTAQIVSGKIEYTPDDRFAGEDSFTYTVSDGNGSTASATVYVTVLSVNDPPETPIVSKPVDGDRAGIGSTVTVMWSGFDIDGDVLSYRLEYLDGATWKLVQENLADTSYDFVIPADLSSASGLKFRVNASDSEYTSDYGYSGSLIVDREAPTGTVVTMRTADGKTYKAGTWTNQTVTVVASSASDVSTVTYYYSMDGGESVAGSGMDVTSGVHNVGVTAKDEFGNATNVGTYLARVDKQQPAVPEILESVSGGSVVLTFTLKTDPGGSGNSKLLLPDGTTIDATGNPTYAVTKNGEYSFTLYDVAGNRRAFTYTVTMADTSAPVITLDAGAYRTGTATEDPIALTLTFTDSQSDIVARGYEISSSGTPGSAYQTYTEALKLTQPGEYYLHAYCKNAFGLTAYETYGPFVIEAAAIDTQEPEATPEPEPDTGDVLVTIEDIEEIPGDTVSIRLPGGEWDDSLTLENVGPGTYLIEAMDENGNIRTVEVRVTMRDIFARTIRSAADGFSPAAIALIALCLAILILLLLASGFNVTVSVATAAGGNERKLRSMRRIKFRKEELVIKLDNKHVAGGEFVTLSLAKHLTKRMRGNTVVLNIRGKEVLREQIPENMDKAFSRELAIDE